MKNIKRQVRAKIGAFFYDATIDDDIEYSKTYDVNCEHHVDFQDFLKSLHDKGIIQHLNKIYGNISGFTNLKDKYYFTEELYIHVEITKERFDEMCLKWEALFKQKGLI